MAKILAQLAGWGLKSLAGEAYQGTFDLPDGGTIGLAINPKKKHAYGPLSRFFFSDSGSVDNIGVDLDYITNFVIPKGLITPCDTCTRIPGSNKKRIRVSHEFLSGEYEATDDYDDELVITGFELALCIFPFFCDCMFRDLDTPSIAAQAMALLQEDNFELPPGMYKDGTNEGALPGGTLPSGSCPHHWGSFKTVISTDQLGPYYKESPLWRGHITLNQNRCPACWPSHIHCISGSVRNKILSNEALEDDVAQEVYMNLFAFRLMLERSGVFETRLKGVSITAASPGYEIPTDAWFPTKFVIVLCSPDYDGNLEVKGHTLVRWNSVRFGGSRSLASMRLLYGAVLPYNTVVYPCNSVLPPRFKSDPYFNVDKPYGVLAVPTFGMGWAAAGACSFVVGQETLLQRPLDGVLTFSENYGADEIWLNTQEVTYVIDDPNDLSTGILNTRDVGKPSTLIDGRSPSRLKFVTNGTRATIASAVERMLLVGKVPRNAPLPIRGEVVETGLRDFQRIERDLRLDPTRFSSLSNTLAWLTFGTRGDLTPPQAMMHWLADQGFLVYHIPCTTQQEGKKLLAALEEGKSYNQFAIWAEVTRGIATIPVTTIAPYFFPTADLPFSLEPPINLLEGLDHGLGFLGQLFFGVMFGSKEAVRVGSWSSYDSVPRSTDGKKFDEWIMPTGPRKIKKAIALGSTSEFFQVEGAVPVPDGDHYEFFKDVEVAYVVGAGTAQTAAAAGCRVVALSRKCDRAFRQPRDVGQGMVFGLRPQRMYAHLVYQDIRRLPYLFPKLSVIDYPHFIQFFAIRWFWKTLFLVLFIMAYVTRRLWAITLAPGFIETIFVNLLPVRPSPGVLLFAPLISSMCTQLLRRFGYGVTDVLRFFLFLALDLYTFPPFFVLLAANKNFLVTCLIALLLRTVGKSFAVGILSFITVKDPEVYVDFRFFRVCGFPVVHTRLSCPKKRMIAEGSFLRGAGAFEPYQFTIMRIPKNEDHVWQLSLPTHLKWEDVISTHVPTACYSLWHNCQVQMLAASGYNYQLLGLAWIMLAPMMIYMLGSMMVVGILVTLIAGLMTIITPLVSMISSIDHSSPVFVIFLEKLSLCLMILYKGGNGLLQKSHMLMRVVQTAWGRSLEREISTVSEIIRSLKAIPNAVVTVELVQELYMMRREEEDLLPLATDLILAIIRIADS